MSAPSTPIMDADEAGMAAREAGLPLAANPHASDSAEHAAWATGWRVREEMDREFPEDPVEDLLAEVSAAARRQETGLDVVLDRINRRAAALANMLTLRAPDVILEGERAGLRKWTDVLLSRTPREVA